MTPRHHLPYLWRYRLLRSLGAKQNRENRRLLHAWRTAEGGTARYNPLNTTEKWAGATDYNSVGVKNYRTGADGLAATKATLVNGFYTGIVRDLRAGHLSARLIVQHNAKEFDTWGTGSENILRLL
jgi:hypothetical protein